MQSNKITVGKLVRISLVAVIGISIPFFSIYGLLHHQFNQPVKEAFKMAASIFGVLFAITIGGILLNVLSTSLSSENIEGAANKRHH
jgi:hypothetical protein